MLENLPEDVALQVLDCLQSRDRVKLSVINSTFSKLVQQSFSTHINLMDLKCGHFGEIELWLNKIITRNRWALRSFRVGCEYNSNNPLSIGSSYLPGTEHVPYILSYHAAPSWGVD